jgi:hypothetical protein
MTDTPQAAARREAAVKYDRKLTPQLRCPDAFISRIACDAFEAGAEWHASQEPVLRCEGCHEPFLADEEPRVLITPDDGAPYRGNSRQRDQRARRDPDCRLTAEAAEKGLTSRSVRVAGTASPE